MTNQSKNPFTWVEIYVNDMNRAQKFYETVLDIQMTSLPMPDGMDSMQMLSFPWAEGERNISGAGCRTGPAKDSGTFRHRSIGPRDRAGHHTAGFRLEDRHGSYRRHGCEGSFRLTIGHCLCGRQCGRRIHNAPSAIAGELHSLDRLLHHAVLPDLRPLRGDGGHDKTRNPFMAMGPVPIFLADCTGLYSDVDRLSAWPSRRIRSLRSQS